ncbi:FUSC family protein [Acetobacter estunensis]|uniref:FUSC family protein n=1 Tax=Acetobacter estunensis TaxID=104097 RepID=A0A967B6T9_9PROT|nr:FUSC family protein [Acetobacter estunensis]NHO53464.1 FUSC family protein [Acetobacter estunensis]
MPLLPTHLFHRCFRCLSIDPASMRWLFAPRLAALGFSLRTTLASLLALAIAFWMELGQPQWAAMTAWIVAQGTRGESISKGYWRVIGTLAGITSAVALVAMTPQQPWLFFPLLATWVGLCTACGTLVHNFRSYAFVLTAYTCAIVAISAVDAQDQVFDIAVARGTYILLGVMCEMVVAMIFVPNVPERARKAIHEQLDRIIAQSVEAVRDILMGRSPPESDIHQILSMAIALNDRMEFSAIETGRGEPAVRNARGTLGQIARFTSRGVGMRSRLVATGHVPQGLSASLLNAVTDMLGRLPACLSDPASLIRLRQDVSALKLRCHADVERTLTIESALIVPQENLSPVLRDRVILQGTGLLLDELAHLLACYVGDPVEAIVSAQSRLVRPPNWRATWANGVRSGLAVLVGAMIWEITAWPQGAMFDMFVAVVCARFASFSNTVLASRTFLYGAVWAVALSIVPVFLVMPITSDYPVLCLAISIPMVIGGLANRNPATAAMAASFVNFFPYMIGPENHGRIDEIQWLNTSLPLLCGLGFGVLIFRHVLPFSLSSFLSAFVHSSKRMLNRISRSDMRVEEPVWVGLLVENMEILIANGGRIAGQLMNDLLRGAFSLMTLGRNLMQARRMTADPDLPADARATMETMFATLARHPAAMDDMRATVTHALSRLMTLEREEPDAARAKITMIIGCLMIVATELGHSNTLIDYRKAIEDAVT